MDLYTKIAYDNSRHLTLSYSTSFGISSRFFGKEVKSHIYAIYALVRIADEIVDTYKGECAAELLDALEQSVYDTLNLQYSTNPVIHAYSLTAVRYGITKRIIAPFFDSMRMDLQPQEYSAKNYEKYIHGSAEVVGLMCLRVFCDGNDELFNRLAPGAAALGAAYQKVNFLRDVASDHQELGRLYFPGVTFNSLDEPAKIEIIADIKNDFARALPALKQLPANCRKATYVSYVYYQELLSKLEMTSIELVKSKRIRISNKKKLLLLLRALVAERYN